MTEGWKTAKDPFAWHSPDCKSRDTVGLNICNCKPMIYDPKFADAFWDALVEKCPELGEPRPPRYSPAGEAPRSAGLDAPSSARRGSLRKSILP